MALIRFSQKTICGHVWDVILPASLIAFNVWKGWMVFLDILRFRKYCLYAFFAVCMFKENEECRNEVA